MDVQEDGCQCPNVELDSLMKLLSEGFYEDAYEFSKKNSHLFSTCSWEMLPLLTEHLTAETKQVNPKLFQCCQDFLLRVAETSESPDEILFELLDKLECDAQNEVLFASVLKALNVVLNRMTTKRVKSLELCFSSIYDILNDLDYSDVDTVEKMYANVQDFYQPYVDKLCKTKNPPTEDSILEEQVLVVFLLQLLSYLSELVPCPASHHAVISLSRVLPSLDQPLSYLFHGKPSGHFLGVVPDLAFQILYWHIFHLHTAALPCVLSPLFLLTTCCPLSVGLLEHEVLHQRGVELLTSLLNHISPGTITHLALVFPFHSQLFQALSRIMVYDASRELRTTCTKLLQQYITIFDPKGRFLLIQNYLAISQHPGISGVLTTQIKEISVEYSNNDNYFTENLMGLVCSACKLPQGNESLLYDISDQVLSALNLIRFLVLRQKVKTEGKGIEIIEDYLKTQFLAPLSKSMEYSRAYLGRHIQEAECLKNSKIDDRVGVMVGNEEVPVPSYDEELKATHLRSTTLDFVQFTMDLLQESWQLS